MIESRSLPYHPCYHSNDTEELTSQPYTVTEVTVPSTVLLSSPSVPVTQAAPNPQPSYSESEMMGPSTIVVSTHQMTFAVTELMDPSTILPSYPRVSFIDTQMMESFAIPNPSQTFVDKDIDTRVFSTLRVSNLALSASNNAMFSDYRQDGITPTATLETPVETSGGKYLSKRSPG